MYPKWSLILSRLPNETDLEFRKRVLDSKSSSFCGAKWYNATIWLGSGMTTSCHHPPAHFVPVEAIQRNPKALHNSSEKKQDRAMMQRGERPPGCEYCWKIEDMGRDAVSDRVYKSVIYTDEELNEAYLLPTSEDANLRTLEISFDRTCQLACSYCNPAFSSTWVKDIKNNGPYLDLVSDGRNHFTHDHAGSQKYKFGEVNPYVEAFFRWWETDLHKTLTELRITGGEPLMSGYTWQLIDWFKQNRGKSKTRLAINSNLAMDFSKLEELLVATEGIELDIYTSNESMGPCAEYIRDGLNWDQWCANMILLMKSGRLRGLHNMATINALCLESLPEFLTQLLTWKSQYGTDFPNFTLNILRFPSFQSPLVLPNDIRMKHKQRLEAWLANFYNHCMLHEHERNHVQRLIDYLDVVKTPHSDAFDIPRLHNDFRKFYKQYDQRRGKNFPEIFPGLADWYNTL
jgi:organic radical activating enzyme